MSSSAKVMSVTGCTYYSKLTRWFSLFFFLFLFIRLYIGGCNINVNKLYPQVSYPVSPGTLPISSLCTWDHTALDTGNRHMVSKQVSRFHSNQLKRKRLESIVFANILIFPHFHLPRKNNEYPTSLSNN